MADKPISELVAAGQVKPGDLFVLEQDGTAKKLTGQILENWLVSFADGHGGIQSIVKQSTSGLTDTYRITMADTTTFDFTVSNGKGITGIAKQSTSGLVDTYKVSYNDGTSTTFTVANGAKGDKGDDAYLWIKYASQEPTPSSHSMSDIPDDWIGVYSGNSPTAPTDYTQYKWFLHKGEQGKTGDPATLENSKVEYQVSDSGTIIPSGSWSASVPVVAQGKYLWTRTTTTFNTGNPVVSYSVSRMGIDGSGSVSSVAGISPKQDGNVELTAKDVGALPDTGGDVTGELRMNGQPISGLNQPTEDTQAANKGYVDGLAVFRDLGTNPIASTTADTTANWAALGNGRAYYNVNGYLIDQPNRYGILLNLVYDNNVFQLFNAHPSGPTYYRSGNSSGWKGTWKKYMDSGQIPAMAAGTAYALQEKFLGKQVYAKLVNCGTGPNNTTKTVAHGLGSNDVAFDIGGMAVEGSSGAVTSSFYLPNYQHTSIQVDKKEIKVYSTANLSGYTVYVWFKYITF